MQALTLAPGAARRRHPLKWLATSRTDHQARLFRDIDRAEDGSRLATLDFDAGWNDVSRLGDLLPDVGISAALATMATERS